MLNEAKAIFQLKSAERRLKTAAADTARLQAKAIAAMEVSKDADKRLSSARKSFQAGKATAREFTEALSVFADAMGASSSAVAAMTEARNRYEAALVDLQRIHEAAQAA